MFEYSLTIGDSVDGYIRQTKVRGVVEGMLLHQGVLYANVYVYRSAGPEKLTAQIVQVPTHQLMKITCNDQPFSDGEILNFIDMALIEKNEEWFNELVTLLNMKNRPLRSTQKLYK